jgi:hypothetical protein
MPTAMTTAARLGIEERQFELTKFLMAEDPLAMVIRAQIHIEEELIAFITARGHPADAIPKGYARRVELALKLGLFEEFRNQLAVLGSLRNRFAHEQHAVIEKEDAETFDAAHEPEIPWSSTLTEARYQN